MAVVLSRGMWEDLRNSMNGDEWTREGKMGDVTQEELDLL